jgi:RHS repeat-associated protein
VDSTVAVTNDASATFQVGVTTVTYTATDAAGNVGTATQLVTVNLVDVTAPTVTAPAAVTVEATGVTTSETLGAATASDVVDGAIVPTNDAPASFPVGAMTVTYSATDVAGNVGTATQVVTITDTAAPTVTAPADITAVSGDNLSVAVTLGTATATDLFAVTVTNDAPATYPVGTTTVTWTVTDANGNSSTATQFVTVTLNDVTPPTITAPANIAAEATGTNTSVNLGTTTATDIVDGVMSVMNDAPASFPLGTTTVTYSATDAAGNISTATQLVTVADTTAPVITAPADASNTSGDNQPVSVVIGQATATDAFAVTITNDAPATFPVGVTTVIWTGTDSNGNVSTATQLVTVNLVDTTAPVVTAPAAITMEATGASTAVTLGTASATDVVDGVIVPTSDAPATFPVGVTTVTYTATDAAGNTATATQTVTVTDTTVPTLTLTGTATVAVEAGSSYTDAGTTATDLVDGDISASVITTGAVDISIPGDYLLTYNVSDAAGNAALAVTRTVTVADTIAPVIAAPAAVTASSGDNLPVAVALGTATATDVVDGAIIPTNDAPAVFPVGATTVTYTAADAAGNVGTATQLVTVNLVDITAPVVTAPAVVTVEATGPTTAVTLGVATVSDVVDGVLVPINDAPAVFSVGTTTVTYSATDAAGNVGTATQLVTVTDTQAPTVTAPADMTVESTGATTFVPDLGLATVIDLVDTGLIATHDAPTSFPMGTTTVNWSVTDSAGNVTTATQLITISDATAPVITAPADITAVSGDNLPVAVTLGTATATDLFAVNISNDAPATFPVGVTTVTWTGTDSNGNVSTATQLVTVNLVDVTAPVVTAPAAVTASSGDNLPVSVTLGAASANDLVDGTIAVSNDAPATFPVGVTTVTYTATDAAGNAGAATQLVTVTLVDTTVPVVTAPVAVTVEATNISTTVLLEAASATDVVDGAIVPISDAPAAFPVGISTVTYTAIDAAGNSGTATQLVTVTDTTVPVIFAPADVMADSINGDDPIVALGTATATDIFSVTIANNAPATFPVGVTTVVWSATDANGNVSASTQLVTVNLVDTIAPVITPPADVFTSTNSSQATVSLGIASANDNVDGIVAVTNNAPATFPVGASTVTYTSTDTAGNTATAMQYIYVSYSSTVGGGTGGGGTTTPPPAGGGATVGMEAVYWHHNDHLGTPQALTDASGTKVWEMSQTPFGITTVNEDPDGDGITVTNNFRFPGQYFDVETGLNYNYFRTYDPTTGRYTQSDPIGLDGGLNTFGYVLGDPVNLIDPFGLSGTIVVNSSGIGDGSSGSGGLSGHSWITYTPDGGTTTTYGTWGNNPLGLGNGMHKNLEKGRVGDATRSAHLSDAEEVRLNQVIDSHRQQGEDGWGYFSPCSSFSSDAWNNATGESLSPYGPYSNPSSLMNSIINANGGVSHGHR